ncbi:MAG: glycerophosphodiester phosphodiesterase family protein [Stellaceae bacterium]
MNRLSRPRVIGHRGAAALAPENTLAGFRAAREAGADWVEFDVQASRDGAPFLLHDARLERTTDGEGTAAALSLAELVRLDAGRWFAPGFAGESVPRLEAALALIGTLGLGAIAEIKVAAPGDGPRIMQAALPALRNFDRSRLVVSSFDAAALALAVAAAPGIPRALLVKRLPRDWRSRIERLGCVALHIAERGLDAATATAVAEVVDCYIYTVNAPARARQLFAWGAHGVFTDRPDVILSAIGQDTDGPVVAGSAGELRT